MLSRLSAKRIFVLPPNGPIIMRPKQGPRPHFMFDENVNFFRLLTFLGLFALHRDQNGLFKFSLWSWQAMYCLLLLLASAIISIICVPTLFDNMFFKPFNFQESFYYLNFWAFPLILVVTFFIFLEMRKVADFFNGWQAFQERFETITHRALPVYKYRFWLWVFGILTTLTTIQMTITTGMNNLLYAKHGLDPLMHNVLKHLQMYMSLVMMASGCYWGLFTGMVKHAGQALVQDIQSLRWMAGRSLEGHLQLWIQLRRLSLELGNVLGWAMIVVFLYMCILTLPTLYIGSHDIRNGDMTTFILAGSSFLYISCHAEMAHWAVHKIGHGFELELSELLLSGRARECESEIVQMHQAVAGCPPSISLGGFFTMDRGLNVSLYSSAVTYIIIIIQFQGEDAKQ